MDRMLVLDIIISTFIVAAVLSPAHAVDYVVTDNTGNSGGGNRFRNDIGTNYARQALESASQFVWQTFEQTAPSDRKPVQRITLIMEISDGIAYTSNDKVHFNANSLGENDKDGFTGVIYHEVTHVWQWNGNGKAPGGLIEGIADFVRLKAGYVPAHWVQKGEGDKWDKGYDVTARFLDYCNDLMPGFVAALNKKMREGYNDQYFVELLGKNVDQLWTEYKAKYGG